MRYCTPKMVTCSYTRWLGTEDSVNDAKELLGASRVQVDKSQGNLALTYRTPRGHGTRIPIGYYIVDHGKHNGGKEVIHPSIFEKRYEEKIQ